MCLWSGAATSADISRQLQPGLAWHGNPDEVMGTMTQSTGAGRPWLQHPWPAGGVGWVGIGNSVPQSSSIVNAGYTVEVAWSTLQWGHGLRRSEPLGPKFSYSKFTFYSLREMNLGFCFEVGVMTCPILGA